MRRLNPGMKDYQARKISRFDAGVRLPLDLLTLDRTARVATRPKAAASLYSQLISESSFDFVNHRLDLAWGWSASRIRISRTFVPVAPVVIASPSATKKE